MELDTSRFYYNQCSVLFIDGDNKHLISQPAIFIKCECKEFLIGY